MRSTEAAKVRYEDGPLSWESEVILRDAVAPRRPGRPPRSGGALPERLVTTWFRLVGATIGNRYAVFAMRILLGSVFLLSACGKLVDITQYSIKPVGEFGILPNLLVPVVGSILPFAELACGLGLVSGVAARLAAFGAALMSAVFLAAKLFLLSQGGDFSCGCFGAIVTTFASLTVYLDPPMFVAALAVMLSPAGARHWLSLVKRLPVHPKNSSPALHRVE